MVLKRFDLLFVKGKSLVGRVIEEVTRSPYSHVAIVIDDWHLVETDWRYPLKMRHMAYRPAEYDVYRYREPFTMHEIVSMEVFLRGCLNAPYDLLQSLTNGLHILTGLPILDAPERLNCSETVDRMFAAAGIDLCPGIDGRVTPADLAASDKLQRIA
ncbi:hypothetical protein ABE430_08815 [Brevibacillus agri]|uniref:hypothetical protein n=1 Tax=Brevibacillus agri TaxID=51101 RepID=UPI003D1CA5F0